MSCFMSCFSVMILISLGVVNQLLIFPLFQACEVYYQYHCLLLKFKALYLSLENFTLMFHIMKQSSRQEHRSIENAEYSETLSSGYLCDRISGDIQFCVYSCCLNLKQLNMISLNQNKSYRNFQSINIKRNKLAFFRKL